MPPSPHHCVLPGHGCCRSFCKAPQSSRPAPCHQSSTGWYLPATKPRGDTEQSPTCVNQASSGEVSATSLASCPPLSAYLSPHLTITSSPHSSPSVLSDVGQFPPGNSRLPPRSYVSGELDHAHPPCSTWQCGSQHLPRACQSSHQASAEHPQEATASLLPAQ